MKMTSRMKMSSKIKTSYKIVEMTKQILDPEMLEEGVTSVFRNQRKTAVSGS